ncbi:SPOSA6832_01826 [Sporobolomyces salmonicolor]|uniref:Glycerol-3-phosphate dehydrogenase [NAD(+)] n=1 Tax=Sporidiobolus salmonicolor TaxID=5005 RepID=A0A0D6EKU8_SPOSA|nr:SPOSA6832_01826 [Sporobolomyces salmonicolor]
MAAQDKWKIAIIAQRSSHRENTAWALIFTDAFISAGSGNWGSAIARLVGKNVKARSEHFDEHVEMWCYEEDFEGRKLTEIINEKHENVKYLPGVTLGDNIHAEPDLLKAVKGANALIFVIPHQFIPATCKQLEGHIPEGTQAISLVKGVEVEEDKIHIFSEVIKEHLGIECAALSGANIANEVARDKFSETTIGCRDLDAAKRWAHLFETEFFRVAVSKDVLGVSLGGALKNVVAVAAGFIDGLQWGNNAKAAIMRIGLLEMKKLASLPVLPHGPSPSNSQQPTDLRVSHQFALEYFPGTEPETFVQESAGIADLITSCLGGRNRKCAEAFVTSGKVRPRLLTNVDSLGCPPVPAVRSRHASPLRVELLTPLPYALQSFDELEKDMLNGQKLQGVQTAKELYEFLKSRGKVEEYPLFTFVYRVAYEGVKPDTITAHI